MKRTLPLAVLGLIILGYFAWTLNPAGVTHKVQLDHSRPRPQGDMWRGAVLEPKTCNPFANYHDVAEQLVLNYTHKALYDIDPQSGSLRPALAESISLGPDRVTLTIRLRNGILFDDGTPVTVADAQFVYDVIHNPDSPGSVMYYRLSDTTSFEKVDARTFRVRLAAPHRSNLALFATSFRVLQRRFFLDAVASIARRKGIEEPSSPSSATFGELLSEVNLPGPATGPYSLASWRPGFDLTLTQNPRCWLRETQPTRWNLAGMRLIFQPDPAGRFASLRKEEIDWMSVSNDLDTLLQSDAALRANYHIEVYDKRAAGQYFIAWNHRHEALKQPEVRRALSMLFDRATIVKKMLGGKGYPSNCFFKPHTAPYSDLPIPSFDPMAAHAILEKAGYTKDNQLKLEIMITGDQTSRQIMDLADPAFENAGIDLSTKVIDAASIESNRQTHAFDGILQIHYYTIHMDPRGMFGEDNDLGYYNPEVFELLDQADLEMDDARRNTIYHQLNTIIAADQPVTMLAFPRHRILLHNRYRGVKVGVEGLIPEDWWVETEDQIAVIR